VSSMPVETFRSLENAPLSVSGNPTEWFSQLIEEAAEWPEPGTRKPYWSVRAGRRTSKVRLGLRGVIQRFMELIDEFQAEGYLALAFGQLCVDDDPLQKRHTPCRSRPPPRSRSGVAAPGLRHALLARPLL
jgi:hypothetical protein